MSRNDPSHQCWYCFRKWPSEELGRVQVAEERSRRGNPVFRVICSTCYQAMRDWYADEEGRQAPLLHGF